MAIILLKSSLIIAILLAFYKIFLERESFFAANRFYLLASLVLAFALPFVVLPSLVSKQGYLTQMVEAPVLSFLADEPLPLADSEPIVSPNPLPETPLSNLNDAFSDAPGIGLIDVEEERLSKFSNKKGLSYWLWMIYIFGVMVFSVNLLGQVVSTLGKIWHNKDQIPDDEGTIVNLASHSEPCSFFHYIFIHPSSYDYETYEQIIAHEKIHVKKWHSMDLLLAEALVILLWFNPFAWILRREIEKNLEYQTDSLLVKEEPEQKEDYQMNLLKIATFQKPLNITTNYNQSLIKQRILKMNAKKSNPHSYWKYAFVAPLIFLTLLIINKPQTVLAETSITEVVAWVPPAEEILLSETYSDCYELVLAVLDENEDRVWSLLKDVDPNCFAKSTRKEYKNGQMISLTTNRSPLVSAAKFSSIRIAKLLVRSGASLEYHGDGEATPLMAAASIGRLEFVRFLVEAGADINQDLKGYGTAYQMAQSNGQTEVVNYLLSKGASDYNYREREYAKVFPSREPEREEPQNLPSSLLEASQKGNLPGVKYWLDKGEDINHMVYGVGSPLIIASKNGDKELVQYLIRKGAEINANSYGIGTPLIQATKNKDYELMEFLIDKGAKLDFQSYGIGSALSVATKNNDQDAIEFLLREGANIDSNPYGVGTPLMIALKNGNPYLAEFLVSRGANTNKQIYGKGGPLAWAVTKSDLTSIDYLLSNGANIDANAYGVGTPLLIAIKNGDHVTAKHLVKKGANVNVKSYGVGTALSKAVQRGDEEMVKFLLKSNADVSTNAYGMARPIEIAKEKGNTKIYGYLIDYGAEDKKEKKTVKGHYKVEGKAKVVEGYSVRSTHPTKSSEPKFTSNSLILAVNEGNLALVKDLAYDENINAIWLSDDTEIKFDDLPKAVIRSPRTALVAAARKGDIRIGRALIEAGADVELCGPGDQFPLMAAAANGHYDFVKMLVENGALVNRFVRSKGKAERIMYAAENGTLPNYVYFIKNKNNLKESYAGEGTALTAACMGGHYNIAKYLLSKGANANIAMRISGSPLIIAVQNRDYRLAKLLVSYGANLQQPSLNGKNALDYARENEDYEMMDLLRKRVREEKF